MSRKGNTFSFRLREIDVDLREAIESIDRSALSDLVRDGLRMVLGIRTTKRVEVTERPLVARTYTPVDTRQQAVNVPSRPAVFIPQRRG